MVGLANYTPTQGMQAGDTPWLMQGASESIRNAMNGMDKVITANTDANNQRISSSNLSSLLSGANSADDIRNRIASNPTAFQNLSQQDRNNLFNRQDQFGADALNTAHISNINQETDNARIHGKNINALDNADIAQRQASAFAEKARGNSEISSTSAANWRLGQQQQAQKAYEYSIGLNDPQNPVLKQYFAAHPNASLAEAQQYAIGNIRDSAFKSLVLGNSPQLRYNGENLNIPQNNSIDPSTVRFIPATDASADNVNQITALNNKIGRVLQNSNTGYVEHNNYLEAQQGLNPDYMAKHNITPDDIRNAQALDANAPAQLQAYRAFKYAQGRKLFGDDSNSINKYVKDNTSQPVLQFNQNAYSHNLNAKMALQDYANAMNTVNTYAQIRQKRPLTPSEMQRAQNAYEHAEKIRDTELEHSGSYQTEFSKPAQNIPNAPEDAGSFSSPLPSRPM